MINNEIPITTQISALYGLCEFDLESFYNEHKGLVKKFLRKNTYSLEVEDFIDVPDEWWYKNKEGILRSNIKDKPFTDLQKLEWIKCALDVVYMTKKYVKIISIDEGIIPFSLYDFQEELLNLYQNNRFVIGMQARQTGKSQTTAAYILHFAMFSEAKNAAILANKADQAQEILSRVQLSYESLPCFLQPGVRTYNKRSVEFGHYSRIFSAASGSNSVRGKSIGLLYIDECAFIPNDMEFYESTYPTVASGKESRVIITSTPNGTRGLFHKLWTESEAGHNDFVRLKVTWDMVPGRDEEWKRQTIANTSPEQFRQEHEVVFRGSQRSLLSGQTLEKLVTIAPVEEIDDLKIYKYPEKDHQYIITVDTSRGVGGDYHASVVIDVATKPYEVVATYRNNTLSPLIYPSLIYNIASKYNDAQVLIEINDIGEQTANILYYDLEYENVLSTITEKNRQIIGFGGDAKMGVRTTSAVKAIGCSTIKTMIEKEQISINDFEAVNEFGTFVPKGRSYEADSGCHDDLVMCLVLFAWATTQKYFIELTDTDFRSTLLKEMNDRAMEEIAPFGIIDNDFGEFTGEAPDPHTFGVF